ncbi:hypothetical protein HOY80DRAFT_964173, partial [Tuber brumale]
MKAFGIFLWLLLPRHARRPSPNHNCYYHGDPDCYTSSRTMIHGSCNVIECRQLTTTLSELESCLESFHTPPATSVTTPAIEISPLVIYHIFGFDQSGSLIPSS